MSKSTAIALRIEAELFPNGRCRGTRLSGYWKGHRCGAQPRWRDAKGMVWCQNHLPILGGVPPTRLPNAKEREAAKLGKMFPLSTAKARETN